MIPSPSKTTPSPEVDPEFESGRPDVVCLTLPKPPSANTLWRRVPGRRKPVISAEYAQWLQVACRAVNEQLPAWNPIGCRFDVRLEVPVSRRDTDNWCKPIMDLCERARVVSNDGNMRRVEVIPVDGRTDCFVALTLLPHEPGVRKAAQPKKMPRVSNRPRASKQQRGGITSAQLAGVGR